MLYPLSGNWFSTIETSLDTRSAGPGRGYGFLGQVHRTLPGGFDMKVLDVQPRERVVWGVIDGPEEWLGTEVRFELKEEDGFTIVLFSHTGWREAVEFMNHCSTKWAVYLMSLKKLVETGKGEPSPHDVQISNWH